MYISIDEVSVSATDSTVYVIADTRKHDKRPLPEPIQAALKAGTAAYESELGIDSTEIAI